MSLLTLRPERKSRRSRQSGPLVRNDNKSSRPLPGWVFPGVRDRHRERRYGIYPTMSSGCRVRPG